MKAEVNQLTAEVARLLGLLSLAGPEVINLLTLIRLFENGR